MECKVCNNPSGPDVVGGCINSHRPGCAWYNDSQCDPDYPVADWLMDISLGDTRLNYWDWVHEKTADDLAKGGSL